MALLNETLVSFVDAGDFVPGKPHAGQVYRWASRGLRGVKLEWVQVGGRRYTSREALNRFFERLTVVASSAAETPTQEYVHA